MSKKKNQRILITGATGFLGKRLIQRLSVSDSRLCLTAFHEDKKLGVERLDLTNFANLKKKISQFKPTIIYHLGALVDLTRSFEVGQRCIEINLVGTFNLLESLRDCLPRRLIFTSTEEVYGDGPIPYREDQLPNPPSPYAVTKIAGEYLANIYAQGLEFRLTIFRIGTMYGPEQPLRRFISKIIIRALKNEDIPLTSGKKKRDYIYVDDVVGALILAKDKEFTDYTTIMNLGGGVSYKLRDVTQEIIRLTKSKSKILIGALPERPLEGDEWFLDNRSAFRFLGWKPKTSLEKGLKETINYHKKFSL